MALRLEEGEKALAQLGGRAHAGRFYGAIENSLQNEVLCRRIRAGAAPCCVLGRTRTLRLLRVRALPASLPDAAQRIPATKRHSETSSQGQRGVTGRAAGPSGTP